MESIIYQTCAFLLRYDLSNIAPFLWPNIGHSIAYTIRFFANFHHGRD